MSTLTRRGLLAALPVLGLAAPAFAQQPVAGEAAPDYAIDSWVDIHGRPTASVMINGAGPFQFLVDTGSATTVISEELAASLGAENLGRVTVIGATGSVIAPLVELVRLQAGVVDQRDLRVAVLPGRSLGREVGILGGDVFAGRRLVFDIREKVVRIEPSRRQARTATSGDIRVRNGLLAEISGRVGNIATRLMLDTGAKSSVANAPLNAVLLQRYPRYRRLSGARVYGVTGQAVLGQLIYLPKVDMQAFTVEDATCIAADVPVFEMWNLNSEPAMIVGIDLLSRLDSFSIDYGARTFDAKLAAVHIGREFMAIA